MLPTMIPSSPLFALLLLLLFAASHSVATEVDIPLVSVRRSVDTSILSVDGDSDLASSGCDYDGGTITLAGPSSLEQEGAMFYFAHRLQLAYWIVLAHINTDPKHCGLRIGGRHHKVDLVAYDDRSDLAVTAAIGRKLVDPRTAVDLILAGYTSYLTAPLSDVVAEHNQNSTNQSKRIMMAPAAGVSSIFRKDPSVFGTIPPAGQYLRSVLEGLATQTDATTLATVWENVGFPGAVCAPVPQLAREYGLELVSHTEVPVDPNTTTLVPTAEQLQRIDPDVVVSCLHECTSWMRAMRRVNWSPRAQVFLICVGSDGFVEAVGTDTEYVMGVEPWHESIEATDALTGWTTAEFARRYKALSTDSTVHNLVANAAGALSVALQAMEATSSYDNAALLTDYLQQTAFQTILGEVSFDPFGQNKAPTALIQYNASGSVRVMYPPSKANGQILYPMPTWDGRDCLHKSDCTKSGWHTCSRDGYCICGSSSSSSSEEVVSTGVGSTAECVPVWQTRNNAWNSPGAIAGIAVAGIVMVAILAAAMVFTQKKNAETYWKVDPQELSFANPPIVVGRGSFGEVLLAEYRGTEVAVKRIVPPSSSSSQRNNNPRSSMNTTMSSTDGVPTTATKSSSMVSIADLANSNGGNNVAASFRGSVTKSIDIEAGGNNTASPIPKLSRKQLEKNLREELGYLSKLRHPCITTVMGAVISPGKEPLMIMEYMDHGSLFDILQNNTMVFEGETLLNILRDVSQGMRFLHASNPAVIHGDLKAANILVDKNFRAKVSDFGLSSKSEGEGKAAGTPYWMAPELLCGESVNTPSSDLYSYGVMVYEVYSRKEPYEGEDPKEVLRLVADPNFKKRPPVPRGCPAQIQSLMSDCLGAVPEERPTFEEINNRLKRMDSKMVQTDQNSVRERSSAVSLFDIFPRHIAEALRDGREVDSEHKDCVTIFFSDIIGFTTMSSKLPPKKVAKLLNRLYTKFDELSNKFDIFKVETIGDAYMAVTNLVKKHEADHVARMVKFAAGAIAAANSTLIDEEDPSLGSVRLRVGLHSGPVVADVVGTRNPRYCLFGDTVNTASRMESSSKEGRIHCSEHSAKLLQKQDPFAKVIRRGKMEIKGKGKMLTFWVDANSVSKGETIGQDTRAPPEDGDFSKLAGPIEEQYPQTSAEEEGLGGSSRFLDESS